MTVSIGSHNGNTNTTSTTVSCTLSPVSGSTLLVGCFGEVNTPVVSDGVNAWTLLTSQIFNGTNGFSSLYIVQNCVGGSLTITGTQSSNTAGMILAVELTGASLAGGPDAFVKAHLQGGTAAVTGASVTTVSAGAIVVSLMGGNTNVSAVPTASPGTMLNAFGTVIPGGMSWQSAPAVGAYHDVFTYTGNTFYDQAGFAVSIAPLLIGLPLIGQILA